VQQAEEVIPPGALSAISTDVLVLGGGLAGFRAALAARRRGARVVIAYQARGASQHIIGFNVPRSGAGQPDSPQQYAHDMIEGGYRLNDRCLVDALAAQAGPALQDLIELGVPLARDGEEIARRHLSGNRYPRSVFHPNGIGRLAWETLVQHVEQSSVQCLPGWKAISLLLHGAGVAGAILSRRDGSELLAVHAPAVVLATGGIGALYADSTYPLDITADSYAFALAAGATLVDMEFVQFEPTVVSEPVGCRGIEMPTAMFADGAVLRNAQGERFMLRHNPGHGEMQIEKAKIALAVQEEIDAGRGLRGAVYFDTSAVPAARLESYVSHVGRLRNAGVDPACGPILVRPAAHSQMGGIRIDAQCGTGVPGLLAAGEASGGVHGASRIAGNGASDAIVFGGIAGRAAAAVEGFPRDLPWQTVHQEALARFHALPALESGPEPGEVKDAVRRTMLECVGIRRSAEGLSTAATQLAALRDTCRDGLHLERPGDRIRAQEALHFVVTAEAIAKSAAARCESRGAHWRIDHPRRDDALWLCHVTARQGEQGDITIGTAPIQ
jgi:succinate dehydrogenase/fumarate reductase flavoprotein subunit